MANIKNLTDKISAEAIEKTNELINNANLERDRIIEKKIAEGKKLEEQILHKAKLEASAKQERILSSSQLAVRNQKLEAKQRVVKKVFDTVLQQLSNMSKEDYVNYIKQSVLSLDLEGEYNLILNDIEKTMITQDIIDNLNLELSQKVRKSKLTLSKEVGNFVGGFILEKNGIELNSTFEAVIDGKRDELENEVIKGLFS
jgi:V/A-type H+-transporting ATPase subunit E